MSISCETLLHPELLSNGQILAILQERHLRLPNLESMERDELLDVFTRFCVPHGQRKQREPLRIKPQTKTPNDGPLLQSMNELNTSSYKPWINDRGKLLPDLLLGHVKRLKPSECEDIPISLSKEDNNKRKLDPNSMETSRDGPSPQKRLRKPITWP